QQSHEQVMEKKVQQVRVLTVEALRQRLSSFEAMKLSEEAQQDLSLELRALCNVYANSKPVRVVDALTPLIVWSNENDSPILNPAFQVLYQRDRDSFWTIGQALLEHEDQRVVDFASQVLEQAEYTEEQAISD